MEEHKTVYLWLDKFNKTLQYFQIENDLCDVTLALGDKQIKTLIFLYSIREVNFV